jgi:hypothetical protein
VVTASFGNGHGLSPVASDEEVVLHGHDAGGAVLEAREGHHVRAHLRVSVASRRTVFVKFFFVKDATGRGPGVWSAAFARRALHRVDFIYRHQANVHCHFYGSEDIEIPDINFAAESHSRHQMQQRMQRIWDRLDDFAEDGPDRVFYNVFCVHTWAVRDLDDNEVGTNHTGGNMCVIEDFIHNHNHAVVLAHELGHFLQGGAGHNNSSTDNLMHESNGFYGGEVLHEQEIRRIRRTLD